MRKVFLTAVVVPLLFLACPGADGGDSSAVNVEMYRLQDQPSAEYTAALFDTLPANLSNSWKIWGHANPLFTQAFGADPDVLVFNDRLYIFMSNDTIQYNDAGDFLTAETDPEGHGPSYLRGIQGIRIISTSDMVNWTDHGAVNIVGTPNTNPLILPRYWQPVGRFFLYDGTLVERSWAPTAAWTAIGGRPQFFLYWGDGGNGVGVVTANSPTGPWVSPLGSNMLIDHGTPGSDDALWLFDPGVFVDPVSGRGYMFLGGGWPLPDGHPGNANDTGNARRVRLGTDMVSLDGPLQSWHVPFLLEACNIVRINDIWYFSYSTHWEMGGNPFGLGSFHIAYMKTREASPLAPYTPGAFPDGVGGFTDPRTMLTRPNYGAQLSSSDNNNHHSMFEFRGRTFITYHTQKVAEAMGVYPHLTHRRLRSAFIDYMPIVDGRIPPVQMTRRGVGQIEYLDPFVLNEAETIAVQGGVYTRPATGAGNGQVVTSIDTGDWLGVYGVDFGTVGASRFMARVRVPDVEGYTMAIELRLNPEAAGVTGDGNIDGNLTPTNTTRITGGDVIGRIVFRARPGEFGGFATAVVDLDRTVTGVHDLVFVFYSSRGVNPETIVPDSRHMEGFEFDQWQFFQ